MNWKLLSAQMYLWMGTTCVKFRLLMTLRNSRATGLPPHKTSACIQLNKLNNIRNVKF
jgi:hypothetical protein